MASSIVAFIGTRRIADGPLPAVVAAVKPLVDAGVEGRVALFDEGTGRVVDVDLSGALPEVLARVEGDQPPRARGRPRLGVVSREVSLLPRHWAWLRAQRGGASATLRRLVDQARRVEAADGAITAAVDATHRFLWDLAGDLPGFEEATRALFARDFERFAADVAAWPEGVRQQIDRFLAPAGRSIA